MKRIIISAGLLTFACSPVLAAPAARAPASTPSITLTGPELDEIYRDLTTPQLFQKQPNGSLQPIVDPGVQKVITILSGKVKAKLSEAKKPEEVPPVKSPQSPADSSSLSPSILHSTHKEHKK